MYSCAAIAYEMLSLFYKFLVLVRTFPIAINVLRCCKNAPSFLSLGPWDGGAAKTLPPFHLWSPGIEATTLPVFSVVKEALVEAATLTAFLEVVTPGCSHIKVKSN